MGHEGNIKNEVNNKKEDCKRGTGGIRDGRYGIFKKLFKKKKNINGAFTQGIQAVDLPKSIKKKGSKF